MSTPGCTSVVTGGVRALTIAGVLWLCLGLTTITRAQETSQPQSGQQSSSEAQSPRQKPKSIEGRLGEETREAAGEEKDEAEQFKKSSSVTLIARLTGLSLQHAYWLCIVINFAIIAGAVFWVSRSRLPGMFRNRTASIQKAMEEARKASEDARKRLAEIETRLARLDTEIAGMQAAAEAEAAAEEARIKAAAEEDSRKVVESVQQEIAAAAKAARRDLKAYAADLAVSLAQRQIRVDSSTDQSLVRSFSDQLLTSEKNGSASGKDRH